jgi:hypothetical protein
MHHGHAVQVSGVIQIADAHAVAHRKQELIGHGDFDARHEGTPLQGVQF